jgi:ABC-type branched-subunit amino acid transport system ATPase component
MNTDHILKTTGLSGGYSKDEHERILWGINLEVGLNETVGILGKNGSGKSTLGKALMNLIPFRSGQIVFNGKDVTTWETNSLAQEGMSMMHQGGKVFPGLSVRQNLELAWGAHPDKDYQAFLKETIPILHNPSWRLMHSNAEKLSGGERHELALAMALARKPRLLILDEPSAGLSPQRVDNLFLALTKIRLRKDSKMGIILIEQNFAKAATFCDRCVIVKDGTISKEFSHKDFDHLTGAEEKTRLFQYLF